MKTLFVIYDEDLEDKVSAIMQRGMVLARYSRLDDVKGARMVEIERRTGYALDRRNRLLLAVADEEIIAGIVTELRRLREREGHGLRAFVVPVEDVV